MTDRRRLVPFDPSYFAHQAEQGVSVPPAEAFRHAYRTNHWAGRDSRSGPGSGLDQTERIRAELPDLLRRFGVRTILDLPCGEARWIESIDWGPIAYRGADLLPELIAANIERTGDPDRFVRLDLTTSPLPAADLLLCRDCLVHLSFADIARAVATIRQAPIGYLLTTTFPAEPTNVDIVTGDWRPINLELPPFEFPRPEEILVEGCTEGDGSFADKSLALWRVTDLPPVRSAGAPRS